MHESEITPEQSEARVPPVPRPLLPQRRETAQPGVAVSHVDGRSGAFRRCRTPFPSCHGRAEVHCCCLDGAKPAGV